MERLRKLTILFWELFKISFSVIGGGYAIIAVADEVFAKRKWIKEGELLDNLPVFQMIPGLIATHSAVYIGNKVAGTLGALVGVIAVAIPAIAVFSLVAIWYRDIPVDNALMKGAFIGLRSALTGIIAATIVRSWKRNLKDWFGYAIMIVSGVAIGLGNVNIALVLFAMAAIGVVSKRVGAVAHPPRLVGGDVLGAQRVTSHESRTTFHSPSWLALLVFLKYGALCFGGGFVIVPMYLADFIGPTAPYLQIGTEDFSNIMALSQMTPGPIGVNCATYFGYRLAGIPGSLIASLMLLLPGSVLVLLALKSLEHFKTSRIVQGILRGVKPASIALMMVALIVFVQYSCTSVIGGALTLASFALVYTKRLSVIKTIFGSGLISLSLAAVGL